MSLNPNNPPGSNFDLKYWELQLPVKSQTSVQIIPSCELEKGYTSKYFFTNKTDGSMTFWCPANGATTPNSHYPRSELRENAPKGDWNYLNGNHKLSASCTVTLLPNNKGIYIGQIHGDDGDHNPQLVKLLWSLDNKIIVEVQQDAKPGSYFKYDLGTFKLGEKLEYSFNLVNISKDNTKLTVTVVRIVNNKLVKKSITKTYKNKYWNKQKCYFKAGAYVQEHTTDPNSTHAGSSQFYTLKVEHS